LFELAGGISFIIYGIYLSSTNLYKIFSPKLESIYKKVEKSHLWGLMIGTVGASFAGSSEIITTTLAGLASEGYLSLSGAIFIMLGANIGGTVITQLASLQTESCSLVLLTIGVLAQLSKNKNCKKIGRMFIGFSFIFLGTQFFLSGARFLSQRYAFFEQFFISSSSALAMGIFSTMIFGNLSVMSIMIMVFGAVGIVDLAPAFYMIMGANIGINLRIIIFPRYYNYGRNFLKKLASANLVVYLLGLILLLFFSQNFYAWAQFHSADDSRQIANINTLYNLISSAIFIVLMPLIVQIAVKIPIPIHHDKKITSDDKNDFACPREESLLTLLPFVSISKINSDLVKMAKTANKMLKISEMIFLENKDSINEIKRCENNIDKMTEKISERTVQISQQNLSRQDTMNLYSIMHIVAEIEHLCDHILDISEIFEKMKKDKIAVSDKAEKELVAVFGKLRIMQNLATKALEENNARLANEIIRHENKVDEIIKKINGKHISRMQDKKCAEKAGCYFSEILYNLERIGDHYDNIAYAIIDRFKHSERL